MIEVITIGIYFFSFWALLIPLIVGVLLQPRVVENFYQNVAKTTLYSIFFTAMFVVGLAVGQSLLNELYYKITVSIIVFFVLSFKSFYNYYRSNTIWSIAQVTSLSETIWLALAMSFDWFIVGFAVAPIWIYGKMIIIGFPPVIFGLLWFLMQKRRRISIDRWQHFFKVSYLISSTFYIFAGFLLIALIYD